MRFTVIAAFLVSAACHGSGDLVDMKPANVSPGRAPQYALLPEAASYQLRWRERTPFDWPDWESLHMAIHTCEDVPRGGPWIFNWVTRRDPMMLVSGDLPRLAMVRTFPEPSVAPRFHKLGDLRIRLASEERVAWLDEVGVVDARFYPWGTVHAVTDEDGTWPSVVVTSFLASSRGMCVEVRLNGTWDKDLRVSLVYGGLDVTGPQMVPAYIKPRAEETDDDMVTLVGEGACRFEDPATPSKVLARVDKAATEKLDGGRWVVSYEVPASTGFSVRLMAMEAGAGESPSALEEWDGLYAGARKYYDDLLAPYEVHTPDAHLDAAFRAGVVNMDYVYQAPAWLEGLHEWPSYFCNNYQISAAVALGDWDRAREALRFFGTLPLGPAPVTNSDGSPEHAHASAESGLPYFIVQLYRYWRATGDMALLDEVWGPTTANLEKMLENRDPDHNLLLNWMQGANAFLYQADHLGLPGDAASPTFMAIGNLEQIGAMAEARGEADRARSYRSRASHMRDEANRRLWREAAGCHVMTVDTQGRDAWAHYYTDFVFPVLYGGLDAVRSAATLDAMDAVLGTSNGYLRSGNLKPHLFGNDMIGGVQPCEAAEACGVAGRGDRVWELLHGVALAATTHTDSPGSFPEYLTDSGHGQADYGFGNPAGAYIQGVVGALFGLVRTAAPEPFLWRPAIPAAWPEARLRLPGVSVEVTGEARARTYTIRFDEARRLRCRLPLYGMAAASFTAENDAPVPFEIEPGPSGGFLWCDLAAAKEHRLSLMLEGTPQAERGRDPKRAWVPVPRLGRSQALALKGRKMAVDLEEHYNTSMIRGRNVWRFGEYPIDLRGLVKAGAEGPELDVGGFTFRVRPSGENMAGVELGEMEGYAWRLIPSDLPFSLRFEVGRRVQGVEFLVASEGRARLTQMAVGGVTVHYEDGSEDETPLVYGGNVDCFIEPFATEVTTLKLGTTAHLTAFAVATDTQSPVSWVEVRVTTPEFFLGILGANMAEADTHTAPE